MVLHGYEFHLVCAVEPLRGSDGLIVHFMPQRSYKGAKTTLLNKYGAGPFCKFRIPTTLQHEGVYAISVNEQVKYIGECENLSRRFSSTGYGAIQPRNCYVGGQATNCKINNLILQNARMGHDIRLWFHRTTSGRKSVEAELITSVCPEWNGRVWVATQAVTKDA